MRTCPPSRSALLLLLGLCAELSAGSGLRAAERSYPPEIIPRDASWSIVHPAPGGDMAIRIPDDLWRLSSLPDEIEVNVRAEIARVDKNRGYIRDIARKFFARNDLKRYRIKADYEHTLRVAAMSIAWEDATGPDPLWRHRPLLEALPAYTRVVMRAPREAEAPVREALRRSGLDQRVTLVPSRRRLPGAQVTSVSRPSRWIRDTFVVAHDAQGGDTALLLPPAYVRVDELADNDLVAFENDRQWADRTLRLPVFVRGGNLHAAQTGNRQLLFVGERELTYQNEAFQNATRHRSPPSLFLDVMRAVSGTADIVVLPNSDRLFHIDQVLAFPRAGVATVIDPVDPEQLHDSDRRVIETIRRLVREAGFSIIAIPTSAARIAAFRSPVNAVAYRDTRSGRAALLAPSFPDERVHRGGRERSLNQMVAEAFASAGVDVINVEDRFSERQGNTHCALLALE